jgi:SprT-like protein
MFSSEEAFANNLFVGAEDRVPVYKTEYWSSDNSKSRYRYEVRDLLPKAKFYVQKIWNIKFDTDIILDKRLKRTLGCYESDLEGNERIRLSSNIYKIYNELTTDDILLHELTHWYCKKTGKLSSDNDKDFKNELEKVGASPTKFIHKAGTYFYGVCKKCGYEVVENRSIQLLKRYLIEKDYHSSCCDCRIEYGGTVEYSDTHEVSDNIKNLNRQFKEFYNIINGNVKIDIGKYKLHNDDTNIIRDIIGRAININT